jgi:hypothetical protein
MKDDELDAKFRELGAFGSPAVDADRLLAALRMIETEADAASVVRKAAIPG